jgi:hypothetical protein
LPLIINSLYLDTISLFHLVLSVLLLTVLSRSARSLASVFSLSYLFLLTFLPLPSHSLLSVFSLSARTLASIFSLSYLFLLALLPLPSHSLLTVLSVSAHSLAFTFSRASLCLLSCLFLLDVLPLPSHSLLFLLSVSSLSARSLASIFSLSYLFLFALYSLSSHCPICFCSLSCLYLLTLLLLSSLPILTLICVSAHSLCAHCRLSFFLLLKDLTTTLLTKQSVLLSRLVPPSPIGQLSFHSSFLYICSIFPCLAYSSTVKMEAAGSSETLVTFCQTLWLHSAEDNNRHVHTPPQDRGTVEYFITCKLFIFIVRSY